MKKYSRGKFLSIFTIPTAEEILQFQKDGKNPLGDALSRFCQEHDMEYLDLIVECKKMSKDDINALFLPCDGHWSETGNEFVSTRILNSFSFYH